MTEWKTYRLGDITIMRNGKKRPNTQGTYPVYGGNGIMDYTDCYNAENTIIVGRVGAYCGNVYQCKNKCWVSDNAISVSANELVDDNYLYYLMSSLDFHHHHIGGAQPLITQDIIGGFEIFLPPLEEQRRIAGILGAIDDKIENNRRINTNLELQAQALYKQWFVDFEFPNEEGKPYKSSGGKMADSELGQIPEGWRVGNIGGYCKIRSGYAFNSSWWTDRGVKIIKIKNITENGVLDMSECSYVDIKHCDKASDFNGHAGDLIIAMTGATLGKVCIIPYHTTDYYINQRVGKFFLGDNPINKLPFIHCILRDENVISEIINKGQGSAQPNISASDVETIKIVMPSNSIMERFNLLLQSNYTLRLKNIALINKLATLRDTLLPKLMNGEIKL